MNNTSSIKSNATTNNSIVNSINKDINLKPFTPLSFDKILGHEEAKDELNRVLSWFVNKEYYESKNIKVPKGVILYGDPGNGKSLFIKEIKANISIPVKIFESTTGDDFGVSAFFKSVRKDEKVILIFDEIDLLLDRKNTVRRSFQEGLDGVNSNSNVFVIAACNDIDEVPYPILRQGRLDKHIPISSPALNECYSVFKHISDKLSISYNKDIDEDEIKEALCGSSFVCISSIVNEIALRYGFENITNENILSAINVVEEQVIRKVDYSKDQLQSAIHEAGHAVITSLSKTGIKIKGVSINNDNSGRATTYTDNNEYTYKIALEKIKIGMAGNIAEKCLLNSASVGSNFDLGEVRRIAYLLVNKQGYSSCWRTLPDCFDGNRDVSFIKQRRNERKIEHILKKCERETYKEVRKNSSKILALAYELNKAKHLTSKQILRIINNDSHTTN